MFWDLNVYKGSRLTHLPKFLQLFAVVIRDIKNGVFRALKNQDNGSLGFNYLINESTTVFDGVITRHNMSIIHSPRMKFAISEASDQCERDYQIPMRLHQAIWAVDYVLSNNNTKDCSFVEIGTGRGYIMRGVLASREFINSGVRNPIFLFDTFSPFTLDGEGNQKPENKTHPFYARNVETVKEAFSYWKNVHVVEGLLPMTLEATDVASIGFVHLDLNNPKVELECLKKLWPLIKPGGVVLSDDYAVLGFNETYHTLNDFFEQQGSTILTSAYGQAIVIKPS